MRDLTADLARYGEYLLETTPAVTWEAEPIRVITPAETARRRFPAWAVAAAAVVAAIVFAAVGVILVRDTGSESAPFVGGDSSLPSAPTTAPTSPTTTADTPTTTSLAGVPAATPSGWCGPGAPPSLFGLAEEHVAWGPDGSKWEAPVSWGTEDVVAGSWEGQVGKRNAMLRQTLPDGTSLMHPLPAIEDFELPAWFLGIIPAATVADLGLFDVEVTADGRVWISNETWGWGDPSLFGVLRYDPVSSTWENVEVVEGRNVPVGGIEATCDGSLWALVIDWTRRDDGETLIEEWWLVRIDGDGVVTRVDVDLPPGTLPEITDDYPEDLGPPVYGPPMMIRADDRAVWLAQGRWWGGSPNFTFPGLARFDGDDWTRHLDGELIRRLSLNNDGTATATADAHTVQVEP